MCGGLLFFRTQCRYYDFRVRVFYLAATYILSLHSTRFHLPTAQFHSPHASLLMLAAWILQDIQPFVVSLCDVW